MTEPTEAEIEAAAKALALISGVMHFKFANPASQESYMRQARAALTAAAQVRERADNHLRSLLLEVLDRDSGNDVPHDLKMRIDAALAG